MIKAVIFDLGGVLVRTDDFGPREAFAARYNMTRRELERLVFNSELGVKAQLGQITTEQLWDGVARELKIPRQQVADMPDAFWGGDRLDDALVDRIRKLRYRYTTALLSNAWDTLRSWLEGEWGIADAFHHIIISAEVGLMKPDPRIYQLALQQVGVAPQEAVFIDDFLENITAARDLGLHAIHFTDPAQTVAELEMILGDL